MRINLEQTILALQQGQVVAIPTETVYGLAADASNDAALQQIFSIKQRPADHPLIVHIGSIDQVLDWATVFPATAQALAQAFWPGALTLVLPAQDHVSRVVRGGEPTVALRVPNHPLTLHLLQQSGLSVAAPSANVFTQLSPTTAAHVEAGLGEAIAVLDGGACSVGIESTIVSVNAAGQWQLLRPGMISEAAITAVVGQPAVTRADANDAAATPKVPGQHALHYSPRTPLRLFADRDALIAACDTLNQQKIPCAAMLIGAGKLPACQHITLPSQPEAVAELLYSTLHQLDAMQAAQLLVELPPASAEWVAVIDRLTRAGHQA